MQFSDLLSIARVVRNKFNILEVRKYERAWGVEELMAGFVGDVGDLSKLLTAKKGMRDIPDADARLQHELADCLWSVIVLADELGIDLEATYIEQMAKLEKKIDAEIATTNSKHD